MKVKKLSIFDENDSVSKKLLEYGNQCFASDIVRLKGIEVSSDGNTNYYIKELNKMPNNNKPQLKYFDATAGRIKSVYSRNTIGIRFAISFDDIEDFDINKLDTLNLESPMFTIGGVATKIINNLIENKSKLILKTGRKHYVNGNYYDELSLLGVKFIRVKNTWKNMILSDGTISDADSYINISITKIPFIVDEERRKLYSSIILAARQINAKEIRFEDSRIEKVLNEEILLSITDSLEHTNESSLFQEDEKYMNRYNFDFNDLSEEEIVEICINSNIAVFLHGQTGVGKTERMLSLDKNLEMVNFGCTREDGFVGLIAKDINSKELIYYEPFWYKNLLKKCKEEPDKIHLLFLDELTNANKDVQKVAFEVTLNKTLTNSGFRLELPENCVVCAAGNESSESRSASPLSSPLFSRFAHVYIATDSEAWLKWALKRKNEGKELIYHAKEDNTNIHPAIIDYINTYGNEVLRTKYNGITPNADPRKWVLASKALYECNNPNVLRAFVGEEITKQFIEFCQIKMIKLEDVLNGTASISDIPKDTTIRLNVVKCLSRVDDENVEIVRNFIRQIDSEFLALFDYEWSKDNEKRIMHIFANSNSEFVRGLIKNEHSRN